MGVVWHNSTLHKSTRDCVDFMRPSLADYQGSDYPCPSGPFANLITNSGFGLGNRPFASGGRGDRGANTGTHATGAFANIKKASPASQCAARILPLECEAALCLLALLAGRGSVAWNLHAKDRSKALDLPDDCEFGPLLSFYGNFQGNKVRHQARN
jgi:hypothetical protein